MTPTEERSQAIRILKEKLKIACTFEDTLAGSGFYYTNSTDITKSINGFAHASSTSSSFGRMELINQSVVKQLTTRRICFTIDLQLNIPSYLIRATTHCLPVYAITLSSQTHRNTSESRRSLQNVNTLINILFRRTVYSSQYSEVINNTDVRAGPQPDGSTELFKLSICHVKCVL